MRNLINQVLLRYPQQQQLRDVIAENNRQAATKNKLQYYLVDIRTPCSIPVKDFERLLKEHYDELTPRQRMNLQLNISLIQGKDALHNYKERIHHEDGSHFDDSDLAD